MLVRMEPVDSNQIEFSIQTIVSAPEPSANTAANPVLEQDSPESIDKTKRLLVELAHFWRGCECGDDAFSFHAPKCADNPFIQSSRMSADICSSSESSYAKSLSQDIDVTLTSSPEALEPTPGEQAKLLERLAEIGGSHTDATPDLITMQELCESQEKEKDSHYGLGDLLVDFGLITEDLLESCIRFSTEYSVSLGRVLIMSGWINGMQLQWVTQLQALLREGAISPKAAAQAADLMDCSGMTFQRALNCVGYSGSLTSRDSCASRMGDLLIEAGIVSVDEFSCALQRSQLLGMQVGRCLMIAGLVAEPLLETVCNAQRFLRQGKISRDEAIFAIRCAASRQAELRKALVTPLNTVRLGELLSLAGIISEAHIDHALEFGLRCNLPLGQVLIDLEIISKRTLDMGLTLQEMVAQGVLDTIQAVYALIDFHHHGLELEQALNRNREMISNRKSLSFEQFLASVEVVSFEQIERSIRHARRSPLFVSRALIMSGAISEETVQVALRCHFFVRENLLSPDQSLLLFSLCHHTGITVEDGLSELGMTLRNLAVGR